MQDAGQRAIPSRVRACAAVARLGQPLPQPPVDPATPAAELRFDIYAYICGLNNMVSGVRDKLSGYGWHKKQIVFERYD